MRGFERVTAAGQRPSTIAVALLLGLLFHAATAALAQQAGAADDLVVLRGRVVAGDASARALPGARVTVAGGGDNPPPVVSDREGRFETRVPARGDWSLRVTKAGFAPVQLENAPIGEVATIRMPPGAAVTGRVVDRRGEPMPRITVRLQPDDCAAPCPVADLFRFAAATAAGLATETDDRGEYRIGSLPSGRYEVSISQNPVSARGIDAAALEAANAMVVAVQRLRAEAVSQTGATGPATRVQADPPVIVDLGAGEERGLSHVLDTPAPANAGARSNAAESAATGSGGTISGRITGPTGQPLGGASIQATRTDGSGSQRTVSNADGQYALSALSADSYRLLVTSGGSPAVQYGQQQSQQQGTPLAIRGNETVSGIDVRLPRGGVISGRVVDEYGEPLEGLSVQAWERRFAGGRTMLGAASGVRPARTDDRGQYRIHGLLPGTYFIVASEPSSIAVSARWSVASTSPDAAALTERFESVFRVAGNIQVSLGSDSLSISMQGAQRGAQRLAFYPSSATPDGALPVQIAPGLDGYGADIVFAPPPGARVSGVALDSSGQPVRGSATLTVSQRSGAPAPPARSSVIAADGTFEFPDVLPGDYAIQVAALRLPRQDGARTATAGGRPAAPDADPEFGMQFVTVSDASDASVSIRTAPLSRLTARVVADGDGSAVSHAGFTFGVLPADLDRAPASMRPQAALGDDWTFGLGSLAGPIRLHLLRAPPGWYLKSAHVAGVDAAEYPVTLRETGPLGNPIDVVVARGGEISGRVVHERDEQISDYAVVVFPIDATRWYDRSRYLKMTRAGHDGMFSVTGLPPGEYWVAAVDRLLGDDASGEWQRPEVLGALAPGARRIRVAGGQQVAVELRLMRMPR